MFNTDEEAEVQRSHVTRPGAWAAGSADGSHTQVSAASKVNALPVTLRQLLR